VVTLTAGKQRRLLFTGDGRRSIYDKKPQHHTEDNRTDLIVCSGKSEAAKTNNKNLYSRYCTVEAN